MQGSVDNICDKDTGKCTCKDNIAGHLCDKSAPGWWNFPNPEGKIDFQEIRILDIINIYFSTFSMLVPCRWFCRH